MSTAPTTLPAAKITEMTEDELAKSINEKITSMLYSFKSSVTTQWKSETC